MVRHSNGHSKLNMGVTEYLYSSKRPLIIAGGGIRLAGAVKEFGRLVDMANMPVVAPLMGIDLLLADNPLYMGHGGTKGQRGANMVTQRADLIISIGSRLCISFIGHNPAQFAPTAKKIIVDIDKKEHSKKTIKIDLFLEMDAKKFISDLTDVFKEDKKLKHRWLEWVEECKTIKRNKVS